MTTARNEQLLGAVTDLVPFLRWRVGPPEGDELAGDELAADPDRLAGAVAATAAGRGTDDAQVAASLWWQSYAYRVAGTTLGCWLLSGAAPDPSAPGTAVGVARSRPSSVVYSPGAATVTDLGGLVDRLFAGHLDRVAASLRSRHALGTALVAGNTASSIESALAAVRTAPEAPERGAALAAVRAALPAAVTATVELGPEGARRRTCCLWWKTADAGGRLCADCSLHERAPGATVPGDD
ncbi:MAG: hypothetical protein ACT4PX_05785 [Actinomycetota bacterium]